MIINQRTNDLCRRYLWVTPNVMKKANKKFDPAKYGMIFCPDCKGLGKSLDVKEGANVCTVCGGFGLLKKEEKDGSPR